MKNYEFGYLLQSFGSIIESGCILSENLYFKVSRGLIKKIKTLKNKIAKILGKKVFFLESAVF